MSTMWLQVVHVGHFNIVRDQEVLKAYTHVLLKFNVIHGHYASIMLSLFFNLYYAQNDASIIH